MGVLSLFHRRAAIAVVAAAVISCGDGPLDPPLPLDGSPPRLQHIVDSIRAVVGVPGAIVAVRAAGEPVVTLTSGVSEIVGQTPMDATARFRIASVSTTMVANVVLQLVDEGALALGDPIETYLPGVVTNSASITVRQLLNHTSGVFDYTADAQWIADVVSDPGRVWSPSQLVAVANRNAPVFVPGAANRWSYSNTNYILLGLLIEQRTGSALDAVLRARLFDPLGMSSSFLATDVDTPAPFSRGYVRNGALVDATTLVHPSAAWAAGGVVSNAADLVVWAEALANGTGLSASLHADRITPVPASFSDAYGLGVQTFQRWVGHYGEIAGYEAMAFSRPGVGTIVVLVNQSTDGVASFQLFDAVRWARFGPS
jgi:D-alanyl-D-alanine carboxypeptidase